MFSNDPAVKRRRARTRKATLRQWETWGLVAAALVAIVLVAAALGRGHEDTASALAVPSPSVTTAPARTSALFFGDSITEGCCRQHPTDPNMAGIAAAAFGWDATISGAGGTGYLTTATVNGVTRPPFTVRIRSVLTSSTAADVIVLEGGGNDGLPNEARFRAAVHDVIGYIRSTKPSATLVVVGPYASGTGDAYRLQRRVLAQEAQAVRAPFLDPIAEGWMAGHPEWIYTDKFHPNSAGQAALGRRLTADLRKVLPSRLVTHG